MALQFKLVQNPGPRFQAWLAGLGDRFDRAYETAARMAAYYLTDVAREDIRNAGNFGSRWTEGLHVDVEGALGNMKISMYHDLANVGANVFEEGGLQVGRPLMWIPLSGTDAVGTRPSEYPGGVFGAKYPRRSGPPLLFGATDRQPKYFGIESVTIPRKWHLHEDAVAVLGNFRQFFSQAWGAGGFGG